MFLQTQTDEIEICKNVIVEKAVYTDLTLLYYLPDLFNYTIHLFLRVTVCKEVTVQSFLLNHQCWNTRYYISLYCSYIIIPQLYHTTAATYWPLSSCSWSAAVSILCKPGLCYFTAQLVSIVLNSAQNCVSLRPDVPDSLLQLQFSCFLWQTPQSVTEHSTILGQTKGWLFPSPLFVPVWCPYTFWTLKKAGDDGVNGVSSSVEECEQIIALNVYFTRSWFVTGSSQNYNCGEVLWLKSPVCWPHSSLLKHTPALAAMKRPWRWRQWTGEEMRRACLTSSEPKGRIEERSERLRLGDGGKKNRGG